MSKRDDPVDKFRSIQKGDSAMKFMLLLCVVGSLFGSGCMSSRITTDFKPEADPELKSPAGKFYVADLKYTYAEITQTDDNDTPPFVAQIERLLLSLLREECKERYPALFELDKAKAIPLGVTVKKTFDMHESKTLGWMFGTLLISGTILPAPIHQTEELDLKVCVWTGETGVTTAFLQKNFQREFHGWMSLLTPAGLIHMPGESDFPKKSATALTDFYGQKTMYPPLASQLATAIAKLVMEKDAAFWEAQRRRTASPGLSPMPDPVILSVPTETVDPF